jgi:hypothetical protein
MVGYVPPALHRNRVARAVQDKGRHPDRRQHAGDVDLGVELEQRTHRRGACSSTLEHAEHRPCARVVRDARHEESQRIAFPPTGPAPHGER